MSILALAGSTGARDWAGIEAESDTARQAAGAVYIRTDNDSLNEPILRINSQLGYKPLRGQYKITANIEDIVRCSS